MFSISNDNIYNVCVRLYVIYNSYHVRLQSLAGDACDAVLVIDGPCDVAGRESVAG